MPYLFQLLHMLIPDHCDFFDEFLLNIYLTEIPLLIDLEDSDPVPNILDIALGLDKVLDGSETGVLGRLGNKSVVIKELRFLLRIHDPKIIN